MIRLLRTVPPGVTKRYWGGGARLTQMRSRQFASGLVNALDDAWIRRNVGFTWCRLNRDVADLVKAAQSRWPLVDDTLHDEAWSFLTTRAQLTPDVLVAFSVAFDREVRPVASAELQRAGERALYLRAPSTDVSSPLEEMRTRVDLLAVETLGASIYGSARDTFVDEALAEGDFEAVVDRLQKSSTQARVVGGYYRLIQGDSDRAGELVEPLLEEDEAGVDGLAISLLSALAGGRAEAAIDLVEEHEEASAPRLAPIRAALALAVDLPHLAVRALSKESYGVRSLRAYPLQLCAEVFRVAGVEGPPTLEDVVARGWLEGDERQALEADIRARAPELDQVAETAEGSPSGMSERPMAHLEDLSDPAATDGVPDEALGPIAALAKQFRTARRALEEATQAQEWAKVGVHATELERLETEVTSQVRRLEGITEGTLRLTVPDASVLASEDAFGEWLADTQKRCRANTEQATRVLESMRNELRRELADAGIEEPEDLVEARDIQRVRELREEYASELTIRTAVQRALSKGLAQARFDRLAADERLEAYRLLADESPSHELAIQVLGDRELAAGLAEPAAEVLLQLTGELAAAGRPPPPGAISMIASALADPIEKLSGAGVLDALESMGGEVVDELSKVFSGEETALPEGLRHRLQLHAILQLPPRDRLPLLARDLEHRPEASSLRAALFRTLAELGRHGEAVYLAGLLARTGDSTFIDEDISRDQLVWLLMSPASWSECAEPAAAILSDWTWWLERDELVATLLYLLRSYGLHDEIINFQFAEVSACETAARRFPALVGHLLRAEPEIESSEQRAARFALSELRHELARESCYSNWVNAVAYQSHFRTVFEGMLRELALGGEVDLRPRPSEIIDEGAGNGVPEATGAARRAMVRFLEDQLERLRLIARVLPSTSLEALEHDEEAWREELADEAAEIDPGSILAEVYRRCLAGVR